jgi:mannose-6-phosphate isomerase-like protein (cupin superfamily)
MSELVFMLTRDDRTVPDALAAYQQVRHLAIGHVGFKDVGADRDTLRALTTAIQRDGRRAYLEVVAPDRDTELAAIQTGLELGVDVLMGGTQHDAALALLAGAPLDYFPFPGDVRGHPSTLHGPLDTIVADARRLAALPGVTGLDLLALRWVDGDGVELAQAVREAVDVPLVVAGSIDSPARARAIAATGAWGYTVGSAAFAGTLAPGGGLSDQLQALLRAAPAVDKVNLAAAFARFHETWSPKVAGDVNDVQVKLAKFAGEFVWHHHDHEDELFLVSAGRLIMRLRDRDVVVDPGEFVIVPAGVEHCPSAPDGADVVLLERASTVNTGSAGGERTVVEEGSGGPCRLLAEF